MSAGLPPPPIPRLSRKQGSSGSNLSLRQNNKGDSYYRLESGLSPRPEESTSRDAPIAPSISLSLSIPTDLYNDLDDHKQWVWIADEIEGYVAAHILSSSGTQYELQTLSGETKILDSSNAEVVPLKRDTIRYIVDDLVKLDDMTIPTIMLNLKERAKKDVIYTNVGSILVSVNPYQLLPIYTPSVMDQYKRQIPNLPPHPFSIADQCYRALIEYGQNQSILVSGESGAGKTETVKVVLQYLAEVAGSSSGVEQKILLANPILEAFGNAKTIRNNNSSRFGKWVEIHFASGRITGAKTTNYLLEKVRVVQQASTERNYHIFYQLLAYVNAPGNHNSEIKSSLNLGKAEEYQYLSGGNCFSIEGVDDCEEFKLTLKAMKQLMFDEVQISVVLKVLAAILHLGNIDFDRESDERCKVSSKSKSILARAANLLAIDPKILDASLTTRSLAVMKETTIIPLNETKARESRDSLAKYLYGELFDWLVSRINESLAGENTGKRQFIGVLDIFGFEIFENNSFEQLCINFTNEKMQQMFNSSIFKEEEAIYQAEGINYDSVKFIDNQVVLDLIEKKPTGILVLLDEQIRIPKSTDKTFLDKMVVVHKDHPNFSKPVKLANAFTVNHYAGSVTYNVDAFLDKNRDQMFDDLVKAVHSTKIPLLNTILNFKESTTAASKKSNTRSLASQFVTQLKDLHDTIKSTVPHYIRCIKPNTKFKPCSTEFDTPMTLRQLRYAGVFEAVAIRKNGFPYRLPYTDFVKRFYMLSKTQLGDIHNISKDSARSKVVEISKSVEELNGKLQFGSNLVFYKQDQLKVLEEHRVASLKGRVIMIQKLWRATRARRMYEKLTSIRESCIRALELRTVTALEEAVHEANQIDWELREAAQARATLSRVREENKLLGRITMMFSNPGSMGELTDPQVTKLNSFLEEAANMDPPFEHLKIEELRELLIRSEHLKALRLTEEAASEAERLAMQTDEERRLREEELDRIEAQRKAEENKRLLKEQLHFSSWEGESSSNSKTADAISLLLLPPPLESPKSSNIPHIDISSDDSPLPPLSEPTSATEMPFTQIPPEEQLRYDRAKNRLLEAVSAPPYSILDGVMFEANGSVSISMSAATTLKQALIAGQQANASLCPDKTLRQAFYTAVLLSALRMETKNENWQGINERLAAAEVSESGFLEVPEISAYRQLASRVDITSSLAKAAADRDEPALKEAIAKALAQRIDVEQYVKIHQALVELLAFIESSLAARDCVKIQTCVQTILQLQTPKCLAPQLERCKESIETRKVALVQEIQTALRELPDRTELSKLSTLAKVLDIKSEDTAKMDEYLSFGDEKYCRSQLEFAKASGNEEKVLQLNIQLKGHLLERFSAKLAYHLAPSLKTPTEFASGKVFGKEKAMDGVLNWTSTPIHAALTRDLDKKSEEYAVKLFKNVMGWMGDRTYSYPITLVHDICTKVVNHPPLRDEIFAQVIKQLSGNPSADSMKRGWQLLLVLLMLVPPSPKFESYIGVWLLQNGSSYHVHELHETVFKGTISAAPTLGELMYILYHLPPTPGESYASAKTVSLEQAEKSGIDLSTPMETAAIERFDKHTTLRGLGDNVKNERKRISDMRPPKRKH